MPLDVPPPRSTRFGSPLVLSRVHWVRPELVAEVKFLTRTEDNLLRQVVYEGLREDSPRPRCGVTCRIRTAPGKNSRYRGDRACIRVSRETGLSVPQAPHAATITPLDPADGCPADAGGAGNLLLRSLRVIAAGLDHRRPTLRRQPPMTPSCSEPQTSAAGIAIIGRRCPKSLPRI
jgi:hypothetical protein